MQNRADYLGRELGCECGRTHRVPVERIVIGAGVMAELPTLLRDVRCTGRGVLVADRMTWRVAGERVARLGIAQLNTHVLATEHPHADAPTAEAVTAAVRGARYLVACGAGTITDLTKYAAHALGIPFIAVATAPSMNGYTSGIVALTEDGLKKTVPSTPARALLADLDMLTQAPLPMIRAGLGDLVSKPVCNADWKLTHLLRGEHFCARPFAMIADLESIYLPKAHLIPQRDAAVIHALIEAIAYSGISMVLAGSSAPASGGEHLISHALDMQQGLRGQPPLDLHGTQVGIATLTTGRLYQQFLQLSREQIDWQAATTNWQPLDAHAVHLRTTWGRAADSVIAAFAKKHPPTHADHCAEVALIQQRWTELQDAVRPFLVNLPAIEHALRAAGAKTRAAELGLTDDAYRATVRAARFIRERYSILDLLDTVGQL